MKISLRLHGLVYLNERDLNLVVFFINFGWRRNWLAIFKNSGGEGVKLYIYIYIFKEKPKTGYFRIINLFPSCFFVSGVNQKHEEKYNRKKI